MNYFKFVSINPDPNWMKDELMNGRGRFGWSGKDCNLSIIRSLDNNERTDEQRITWTKTKFLVERLRVGDRLIIQLEQPLRQFYLAEVTGEYFFDEQPKRDFNHIIPIRLICEHAISMSSRIVSNNMRNDLTKRGHYYCVYPEKTIRDLNEIIDGKLWLDEKSKESTSYLVEIEKTNEIIRNQCIETIRDTWKSKHFEEFVFRLMSAIPNIEATRLADSGKGWDLLIRIMDPISGNILHDDVPVQCKNFYGEVTTVRPIEDLERSIKNGQSDIAYLVIIGDLTDEFLQNFENTKSRLKESNLNVDMILVDQVQVAELYMKYKSNIVVNEETL